MSENVSIYSFICILLSTATTTATSSIKTDEVPAKCMRQNGVGLAQPAKVTLSRVRAQSLKTAQTGGLSRNVGKLRGTTNCHSYLLVAEQIHTLFPYACCSMTSTTHLSHDIAVLIQPLYAVDEHITMHARCYKAKLVYDDDDYSSYASNVDYK